MARTRPALMPTSRLALVTALISACACSAELPPLPRANEQRPVTLFVAPQTLLFEVRPSDPLTLTLVVLALSAVGLLACAGPALRAAGVDPIEALRRDS